MSKEIEEAIRSTYGSVAQSGLSNAHSGVRGIAEAFGYTADQLASIPAEANLGLSCGNPTAFATLKPGEVVVDLGCGAGLDVFLAASKVGPTGKAIGIDMTPEMLARARRNAATGAGGRPITNVEFHHATIDQLPLADASVDCVISNCVINLAPDKSAVFREIARVLKPGGRLAISDIALKKPAPEEIADDLTAYVGCIAGAISVEDYRARLAQAGFGQIDVIDTGADLNAYAQVSGQTCCAPSPEIIEQICCVPSGGDAPAAIEQTARDPSAAGGCCSTANSDDEQFHSKLAESLAHTDVNEYAASVRVYAIKPQEA